MLLSRLPVKVGGFFLKFKTQYMDKYDERLLRLVGKVADHVSDNVMIIITGFSLLICAFLS